MEIVSLFAGCGGLDLGLEEAGHEVIWANDNWEKAAKTYRENFDNPIEVKDIGDVKEEEEVPECDMIVGGWPCQGFTVANLDRSMEDERNKLYEEMLRIVKSKKPKFVMAENVPGILSMADGEVADMITEDFEEAGYNMRYKKMNSANYGVPQKRKRVIWIGVREDVDIEIEYPEPTHRPSDSEASLKRWTTEENEDKPTWRTLRDAIEDVPEPDEDSDLPNVYGSKHKVKVNGHIGNRKLEWDEPSPTITGRGEGGGGPVIHPHPELHRRMTVRECARVQSFPDDFVFKGSMTSEYGQIGNAVPPLLAYHLGKEFPVDPENPNSENQEDIKSERLALAVSE